jgi:hypothetical protein
VETLPTPKLSISAESVYHSMTPRMFKTRSVQRTSTAQTGQNAVARRRNLLVLISWSSCLKNVLGWRRRCRIWMERLSRSYR